MPDLTMLNRELAKARVELEILRRELLGALAPESEDPLGNAAIAASRMREIGKRIEALTRAILRPSAGLQ